MKSDKIKVVVLGVLAFIIGSVLGLFLASELYAGSEFTDLIAAVYLMLAISAIIILLETILKAFVIPYFDRRKAAIRALGKDGVRILRKDEVARLAYKGIYAIMKGEYPKAEDYLQQAMAHSDVRQNQTFCVEWLIRLYEFTENESKLTWAYRKAVELSPENSDAQSRLGHSYFNNGYLEKAEYCFEQALKYDANDGYAYFSLSKIYMLRGEDDKAFEVLQKLLKVNEQHPLCHQALADYYAMRGDRQKAEEECKKAEFCGIREPDELNKRINAMLSFHSTEFSGEDLPSLYYRRIEKKEDNSKND